MNKDLKCEKKSTVELSKDRHRLVLCRCWLSATFPYCDGAHKAYNAEHNDHVGPVVVTLATETDEGSPLVT